jgi:hypothetical protein
MTLSRNRAQFEELIKRWIVLENETIDSANDLMNQSNNPYVRTIIDLVRLDSEKHKHILETIRLSLDHTVVFSPDDLKVVDTFINKHASLEKTAVDTAEQALGMGSLPIPKFLLEHLLVDEKKHDNYMSELNGLKAYMAADT